MNNTDWKTHLLQWRGYVIEHSKCYGLTSECLSFYDSWTETSNAGWTYEDFAKMANDALSEWDI